MKLQAFEVLHNPHFNKDLVVNTLSYLEQHKQAIFKGIEETPVGYVVEGFNPVFNEKPHHLLVKQLDGGILIELYQKNVVDYTHQFYLALPYEDIKAELNNIQLSYKAMH